MRRTLSLRKKIAILMSAAVCATALAAWCIVYGTERSDRVAETNAMLSRNINLIAKEVEKGGEVALREAAERWTELYPDGRLTAVDAGGRVLLDTKADAAKMENHYMRGEIIAAFTEGEALETRYSVTQKAWQIYAAKRILMPGTDGGACVVRLSYPFDKLSGLVRKVVRPFAKYFLLALLLVWGATCWLLRVIMEPLDRLSRSAKMIAIGEDVKFPVNDCEELSALARSLNSMRESLKEKGEETRQRKEELSQLVGALPIGVILIDAEKRIRYINGEAERICGVKETPKEGDQAEAVLQQPDVCDMFGGPDASRRLSILKEGYPLSVEATTLSLPRGRLVMLQDMTESARLEEARREFLVDAGHEFQTPLAIIRAGLELLASSPLMERAENAEDAATIKSVISQQERISSLVDDLLLLSRLEAEPLRVGIDEVELSALFSEVRDELLELPRQKATEVTIEAPKEGAFAKGVRQDLRRAISNLMENALKYSQAAAAEKAEIRVRIGDAGDKWRITVDDNGPGIADNEKEVIFERFRRGDSHRARKDKKCGGYGLGLSIARRVAERHGGTLTVEKSELGGACFVLTLPKEKVDDA
ncbi:MAG: ATP-binding protein [Synergistes jonesii]|uniref:ATP-binding protein n=1 Tax=Synergistes jonesii TaxID=2754 RepID=UPI002A75DB1E|nr:ATP-binding protein [Synergistes jonesii]MDY2985788.1 ATP-binding protein [Synergistes jonesii]